MRDPEASWSRVCVQEREAAPRSSHYVVGDVVVRLSAILNKDRMTQCVPVDVPLDSEVLDAVEGRATIVAAHDYVVFHVGLGHFANHMVMDGVLSEHESLANIFKLHVLDPSNDGLVAWGVKHYMCSKLVLSRCLRIASVDNVAGHKADFCSHCQDIGSCFIIWLSARIVLVCEWCVESDCALPVVRRDPSDGSKLSVVLIIVRRCDHDVIADLPVDLLHDSQLVESCSDCGVKLGPRLLLHAVHVKHTVANSYALLAENWLGWVAPITVHRDGQLRLVRVLFCTHFHCAAADVDVACVKSRLIARVIVVGGEDERPTVDRDKSQLWRILDIDEEAESGWHTDALSINGWKYVAPGGVLRPQAAVAISVALECRLACSSHHNIQFGVFVPCVGPRPRCARNFSVSDPADWTVHIVDGNLVVIEVDIALVYTCEQV